MNIKPIKNDSDYNAALNRIDELINAAPRSPEDDELEVWSILVENYENKHHPIQMPHPIEAIKFRMDQMNLNQTDVAPLFGGKSKASEVLSGKRGFSLTMVKKIHKALDIPFEVLLQLDKIDVYEEVKVDFSDSKSTARQTYPAGSARRHTFQKVKACAPQKSKVMLKAKTKAKAKAKPKAKARVTNKRQVSRKKNT